tara:strand:+ start:280 stop:597 length:318 start_codon:yes stop_codon:yes gene_type:complete
MIKLKIDVTKIDKSRLFVGAKGTYLDLVVYENDRPDEYGNDYAVKQDCTREDRDAGVKMPYIGNGKNIGQKRQQTQTQPARTTRNIPRAQPQVEENLDDADSIPF